MIELGAIASATTNLTSGGTASADRVDLSFSPYPGKNGADTGTATMSFGDFLDMINPLQHIPVISSLYRAATGDTISPVARIAGDALYGGIMGVASAGLSALGAIGDEVLTAADGGKSAAATVVASLFGDSNKRPDTQLASATPAPPATPAQTQLAGAQAPQPQQVLVPQTPAFSAATPQQAAIPAGLPPVSMPLLAANKGMGLGIPLNRSKLPYGGVMDPTLMQNAQQNQALALALASGANNMQAQRLLRDSRFAVGTPATPPAEAATPPTRTTATAASSVPQIRATPQTQAALQNLITQLQANKSLNLYRNTAQMTPVPGSAVDFTN